MGFFISCLLLLSQLQRDSGFNSSCETKKFATTFFSLPAFCSHKGAAPLLHGIPCILSLPSREMLSASQNPQATVGLMKYSAASYCPLGPFFSSSNREEEKGNSGISTSLLFYLIGAGRWNRHAHLSSWQRPQLDLKMLH